MDPEVEWTEDIARVLDLPPDVDSKEEAIEQLLLFVEQNSPAETGALRLLGSYFLDRDCEKAKHYLSLAANKHPVVDGESASEILNQAEAKGCRAVFDWLVARRKGGDTG